MVAPIYCVLSHPSDHLFSFIFFFLFLFSSQATLFSPYPFAINTTHPSDHLFSSISARKFFFFVVSFFFCSSSPNFLVWSCTPWPGKDGFGFGFGVSKYPHEWVSKYPFLEHGGWGFGVVSQPRPCTKILQWAGSSSATFQIWFATSRCLSARRHRIGSVSARCCHRRCHWLRWRWN